MDGVPLGSAAGMQRLLDLLEDATPDQLRTALRHALLRISAEIDAAELPEHVGKPAVPAAMLRTYVHDEVACALGLPDHRCLMGGHEWRQASDWAARLRGVSP